MWWGPDPRSAESWITEFGAREASTSLTALEEHAHPHAGAGRSSGGYAGGAVQRDHLAERHPYSPPATEPVVARRASGHPGQPLVVRSSRGAEPASGDAGAWRCPISPRPTSGRRKKRSLVLPRLLMIHGSGSAGPGRPEVVFGWDPGTFDGRSVHSPRPTEVPKIHSSAIARKR
jgi:hypothetical protein